MPSHLHPALLGAAVVCFLAGSSAGWSADNQPPPSVLLSQDQCKQNFNSGDAAIYADDGTTLKLAYDPKHNCDKNAGDETLSHNSAAVELTRDIANTRSVFANDHASTWDLKSTGACRLAYQGVKDVFDYFAKAQADYCQKLNAAWDVANKCGTVEKSCQKEWEAFRDVNKTFAATVQDKGKTAVAYLSALALATSKARDSYTSDFKKLDSAFQKRSLTAAASAPLGPTLPDAPEVKATNGNKFTQNTDSAKALEAYYNLLKAPDFTITASRHDAIDRQSGLLIQEEAAANANLLTFGKAIQLHLSSYRDTANSVAQSMNDQIARIAQNGATSTDSTVTSNINKYAPVMTAAAPLAQKMFAHDGNDIAGLGQQAAAAASREAPVAEVAAAAGLGALAAHSLDGASRAPSGGPAEAPAVAPGPTANAHPDTGSFGEPPGKTNDHAASPTGPTSAKNDGAPKIEGGVGGEPGVNSGGGPGLSDGSSRARAGGKKSASATPAGNGAPVDAGGAGTPESMGAFTPNLEPKAAPKAAASNPGSEVANLLGQMKNLFNFDENSPMGGAPGAALPPGAVPPVADAGNGAAAAPEAPGEAAPAGAPEEAAAGPANSGIQSDEVHGSPYGKVDTSLFARVRARHHRCMERGLVLYGLRERVE